MKKIIYSLVIMIAACSLFTSCIDYQEPVGIQELRLAKADYLDALSQLRAADAELQLANAAYRLAETALKQADADYRQVEVKIKELEYELAQAQNKLTMDSIALEITNMQERQAAALAAAKTARANAEEALRVALANIEAALMTLTSEEADLVDYTITIFYLTLDAYNDAADEVTIAETNLWNANYTNKDSIDWEAKYTADLADAEALLAKWAAYLEHFTSTDMTSLAAWEKEIADLQDSIDKGEVQLQLIAREEEYYKVNTFCEANEAYKAKVNAYLAAFAETNGYPLASAGAAPTKAAVVMKGKQYTYTHGNYVSERFNAYVNNMLFNGTTKYASVEGNAWNRQKGAITDSLLAKAVTGTDADTLTIYAKYSDKGIILDGTKTKVRRSDAPDTIDYTPSIKGLNEIIETLERELVIVETSTIDLEDLAKEIEDAQKAYDDAKAIIDGGYKPVETATKAAQAALKAAVNEFIAKVADYQLGLSGADRASYADSVALYNAIIEFEEAKAIYMGIPDSFGDTLEYKNTVGTDIETPVVDLEFVGLKQNRITGTPDEAASTFRSVYGGEIPYTVDELDSEYNQWNLPAEGANDAFVRIIREILKSTTWTFADAITAADLMNPGVTIPDSWTYVPATGAITGVDFVPVAEIDYRTAACEFWGYAYSADAWNIVKDWKINFTPETFTAPEQAVIFTGFDDNDPTDVVYSEKLAIIIENIDGMASNSYASLNNEGVINYDVPTGKARLFANALASPEKGTSLLFTLFYKQQRYDFYNNTATNQAVLAELKALVEQVAADFDAADAAAQAAYESALTKYNAKKAIIEAAYTELTGKKNGTIVIDLTDKVDEGEYILGGLQKTWAEELAPEYPVKMKEWADAKTKIGHYNTVHFTPLKTTLNTVYKAILELALSRNEDFDTFVSGGEDYPALYKQVIAFVNDKITDATDDVADAKSALERYKAGYDGKALAIQMAEEALAEAKAKLEIMEDALAYAQAQLDAVIAKYLK